MADDPLADVSDELYGVPPQDFVTARTQARDRARADGDKELARAIAALPKPAVAAWACNLLVRSHPEEIAQLVELGGMMREAQRSLSGEQLRELGKQRGQVISALTRQARALAADAGHPVSDAVADQVEATLRAAVADPDAGQALLGGQLTSALSYTGLGPVDVDGAVATPVRKPAGSPPPSARRRSAAPGEDAGRQERAAAERRRREAEQRRREIDQAERDAQEAEGVARDTAAAAEAAGQRLAAARLREEELRTRVAELEDELRRTRQRARSAEADAAEAGRRSEAADRRAQTAAAIRDRARSRAEQLRAAEEDRPPP